MADIFISYAKEDRSRIIPLVQALEEQGCSCLWGRNIPAGKTWRQVFGEALENASAVIVAWSKTSVKSDWVQAEADRGLRRDILFPIFIDDVKPPPGFGPSSIQATDLANWQGDSTDPKFQKLLSDLNLIIDPLSSKANVSKQIRAEAEIGNIFISYSKKDKKYVQKLTVYLENKGLSVWVDDRIDHGDRWWRTIVDNIRKCAAMVVVMTAEGEKSDWVQKEYFYANNLGKPLITLLLKDECFPFFVTHQYHDVRDGSMPPKKFVASLKQFAGQKHEEELKQKEKVEERRHRAEGDRKRKAGRNTEDELKPIKAKVKHRAKNEKEQKEELKRRTIPRANAKSIGIEFVLIPAGSFIMGSPQSEKGRMRDENQHEVAISRPFYMQTTEVTQSQWEKVIGDNPSYFKNCGDDCPVDNVSWNDAQEFISMLNQIENTTKYRLPNEAEWEYACRAGTETAYSFDEEDKLGEYAWYRGNSDNQPQPVMQKMPNPWGLYDMYGNVWEWCLDWYGDYPSKSVIDQKGLDKGEYRVLRGGSWNSPAKYLRSAFRGRSNPDYRFGRQGGFRIVQDY